MNMIECLEARLLFSVAPLTVLAADDPGDTISTALIVGALSGKRTFNDSIGNADTDDYYKLTLKSASNFNVILSGLSQNADLQILSKTGNELDNATNTGTSKERISRTLNKGT